MLLDDQGFWSNVTKRLEETVLEEDFSASHPKGNPSIIDFYFWLFMRRFAARLRNFSKSTRLLFLAASIVTLQHKDTIFPVKCWGDDPPYRKL